MTKTVKIPSDPEDQRIFSVGTTLAFVRAHQADPYERREGLCRWRCSPLSPRLKAD